MTQCTVAAVESTASGPPRAPFPLAPSSSHLVRLIAASWRVARAGLRPAPRSTALRRGLVALLAPAVCARAPPPPPLFS